MSESQNPDPQPARVFGNLWADATGPADSAGPNWGRCQCFAMTGRKAQQPTRFHRERQDTSVSGWIRLLELVEEAAADGREVFKPFVELTAAQRREIVTLPASIAELTAVKHLIVYGSFLVRIPPEIGLMESLEEFTPYVSHQLHWFPYELTRCRKLRDSTVSTRAIYGNFKYRPQFPALTAAASHDTVSDLSDLDPGVWGATSIRTCSVCDGPVDVASLRQVWISQWVGTDVLPLLVNACSKTCVEALPQPPEGYVPRAHAGGPDVEQPTTRH